MTVFPSPNHKTAKRLGKLAKLYESGQVSATTARAVDKLLAYESSQARVQLVETKKDLAAFEAKYGLTTEAFFKRYQAGKTDDRMDYVEWAALAQMAENLRKRLKVLDNQS